MITTYLRSSSYSTYDLCETKYLIEYVLGYKSPTGKAALKGTIVHKVMEVLARIQLNTQKGLNEFFDTEFQKFYQVYDFDLKDIAAESYKFYTEKNPHLDFEPADFRECLRLINKALESDYNPLQREIFEAELFFDLPIEEEWAKYDFKIGNKVISGNLAVKGTIDLITKISDDTLEVIDWKTGKFKKDWATNKDKDYDAFREDFQIRLYHYALKKMFPEIKTFMFTVYFIYLDSPNTVFFTDEDLPRTLEKIKTRFEKIKSNVKPTRIKGDFKCKWCEFSKDNYKICDKVTKEVLTIGIDRVTSRYIKDDALTAYSGGGRDDKGKIKGTNNDSGEST